MPSQLSREIQLDLYLAYWLFIELEIIYLIFCVYAYQFLCELCVVTNYAYNNIPYRLLKTPASIN